jgi:hypothetical protein
MLVQRIILKLDKITIAELFVNPGHICKDSTEYGYAKSKVLYKFDLKKEAEDIF